MLLRFCWFNSWKEVYERSNISFCIDLRFSSIFGVFAQTITCVHSTCVNKLTCLWLLSARRLKILLILTACKLGWHQIMPLVFCLVNFQTLVSIVLARHPWQWLASLEFEELWGWWELMTNFFQRKTFGNQKYPLGAQNGSQRLIHIGYNWQSIQVRRETYFGNKTYKLF